MEIKRDLYLKRLISYMWDGQDGTKGQIFYLEDLTCEIDGVKYVSWKDWGA